MTIRQNAGSRRAKRRFAKKLPARAIKVCMEVLNNPLNVVDIYQFMSLNAAWAISTSAESYKKEFYLTLSNCARRKSLFLARNALVRSLHIGKGYSPENQR